ncbi:hypothetical protein HK405_002317, partial [Cladochytrium tenue]
MDAGAAAAPASSVPRNRPPPSPTPSASSSSAAAANSSLMALLSSSALPANAASFRGSFLLFDPASMSPSSTPLPQLDPPSPPKPSTATSVAATTNSSFVSAPASSSASSFAAASSFGRPGPPAAAAPLPPASFESALLKGLAAAADVSHSQPDSRRNSPADGGLRLTEYLQSLSVRAVGGPVSTSNSVAAAAATAGGARDRDSEDLAKGAPPPSTLYGRKPSDGGLWSLATERNSADLGRGIPPQAVYGRKQSDAMLDHSPSHSQRTSRTSTD